MSDDKDMATKENERLLKSLSRTQKTPLERKKEEEERKKKYDERKKKEDDEKKRVEELHKKTLADKEASRQRESALEKEREEDEKKAKAAKLAAAQQDDGEETPENVRREQERFDRAFRGNIPETSSSSSSSGVVTTSINEGTEESERASLSREEERMAKMFGGKTMISPRGAQTSAAPEVSSLNTNIPPALRKAITTDPNPHVVNIQPRSDAPLPPALRTGKGDTLGGIAPPVKTVVVPAAPPKREGAIQVGEYDLPAYGPAATVELDCNASRKFWTVKVLPCKYAAKLEIQIAGGTVDFLAHYNGGTHPRSVDLPLLVKLRPDCVELQSKDPTGITFQIHV